MPTAVVYAASAHPHSHAASTDSRAEELRVGLPASLAARGTRPIGRDEPRSVLSKPAAIHAADTAHGAVPLPRHRINASAPPVRVHELAHEYPARRNGPAGLTSNAARSMRSQVDRHHPPPAPAPTSLLAQTRPRLPRVLGRRETRRARPTSRASGVPALRGNLPGVTRA